ncbi:GGDEF domain-containing protein [Arhodomonas sp. AD133]|uniref:GGDEF domain-containing protein n=1 Tax=Arhodomonas sp. AD133 TaxID=3415009 RepID=UPI003EB90F46
MFGLSIVPRNDPFQGLRIKRFLMAGLVYVMAVVIMGLYVLEGLMAIRPWLSISAALVVVNAVFYAMLRSGRNERLRDPSLTGVQMVTACVFMTVSLYFVYGARGALLLLYMALLMFGVFRLRNWQFTVLGLFAMACYGGAVAVVYHVRPWAVDLREETLQFVALAVIVPCGGFFAGYVDRLRRQLKRQQIELQQAREKVHDLSVLDPLTGLSNRHAAISAVSGEVTRGLRLQQPLTVAMVDLDNFKAINREFGHERGDQVLKRVAQAIGDGLRAIDTVGRYGGEEFIAVLPDVQGEEALERARVLCERVRDCRFQALGAGARLSASVGVTALQEGDDTWTLISRARAAADEAHERGGNRVVARGIGDE